MKIFSVIFLIALLPASVCNKSLEGVPDCVQKKINQIKAQAKWNPPAQVNEYQYKGQRVFLFSSDCCDQFNYLYSESCTTICAPSGGFTGRGDGKCSDFDQVATFVKLIWKDPR